MTLDLAKLRAETLALLDGTTPGPWDVSPLEPIFEISNYQFAVGTADDETDARLIAAAPTLAADTLRLLDEIERLTAENERMHRLTTEAIQIFENCSVEAGVCGCGDDMERHPSPMDCGHTPTDLGGYEASRWLTAARAAIKESRHD